MNTKAGYVKKQTQSRRHTCHWPNCERQVPPAMWGCKVHWFKLPRSLRNRVWAAYRPGQENDLQPSEDYFQVADDVQKWCLTQIKGASDD